MPGIHKLRPAVFVSILCFLVGGTTLRGQTTSVIQGTVIDPQGLAIIGAEITVSGPALAGNLRVASDESGSYRLPGLVPGVYSLRVTRSGFGAKLYEQLPVTINRILEFDIELPVGGLQEEVKISAQPTLLEPGVSSSGSTILPQQIEDMPINGRNYLDLMQLVPGVAINRQADAGTDAAAPIVGRAKWKCGLSDRRPAQRQRGRWRALLAV